MEGAITYACTACWHAKNVVETLENKHCIYLGHLLGACIGHTSALIDGRCSQLVYEFYAGLDRLFQPFQQKTLLQSHSLTNSKALEKCLRD